MCVAMQGGDEGGGGVCVCVATYMQGGDVTYLNQSIFLGGFDCFKYPKYE